MEEEKYMRRCIELAKNGLCNVSPNPMVGAVIVCHGRIIGEGYHIRCGEAHAEVNAIRSVKDESLLKHSTIYVSLEPCSHYGKTPPCADLIIEKQIPRIVIGCQDPFSEVAGRGIQKLRDAGREVTVGILEEECQSLIRRFITFNTLHRPYITLKWAESADRFIDIERTSGMPLILSSPLTSMLVHKKRAEADAIMVGRRTALLDNPSLTVRNWYGHNPIRVVLDRTLSLPNDLQIFDGNVPTLVFTEKKFRRLFPSIPFKTEMAWCGTFSTTKDGLPFIGNCPDKDRMFFDLGYGGNGITFSMIGAQIICKKLQGIDDERGRIFGYERIEKYW